MDALPSQSSSGATQDSGAAQIFDRLRIGAHSNACYEHIYDNDSLIAQRGEIKGLG